MSANITTVFQPNVTITVSDQELASLLAQNLVLTVNGGPPIIRPVLSPDLQAELARQIALQALTYDSGTGFFKSPNFPDVSFPSTTAAAPAQAAQIGNRTVFLGDSITQGSDQISTNFRGTAWPIIASIRSGGRILHARNAGIGGNTTQGMIDRFTTDVTPFAPTTVSLLAGTNDSLNTPFATWTAQMQTLVGMIRSIRAVPVMGTIPPNDVGLTRKQAIIRQNVWIRDYANRNGIALVDFYTLLADPATGNYKTVYFNDGTHPNATGYAAMGALYADSIAPTMPAFSPTLTGDDGDPYNLISGGCFTAASGSALPAGWTDNAGTPANSALSYVTDAAVPGQLLTVTNTGATGIRQVARTLYTGATTLSASVAAGATTLTIPIRADFRGVLFIGSGSTYEVVRILSSSGGGPQTETLVTPLQYAHSAGEQVIANAAPGDVLLHAGRVAADGGISVTATINATGGANTTYSAMGALVAPFTRGVFAQQLTVPAGTSVLLAGLQNGTGTGTVAWGQVSLYNLTRMGLA